MDTTDIHYSPSRLQNTTDGPGLSTIGTPIFATPYRTNGRNSPIDQFFFAAAAVDWTLGASKFSGGVHTWFF
jgi:hypothetical protein